MNLLFDLKYAWRLLLKSWGYSLMCASVVALSVGLAVWTYALTYSQILKPLPFRGSDDWYSIQMSPDGAGRSRPAVDAFTWQKMLERSSAPSQHLGAFAARAAVLSEGEATTTLRGIAITPRLMVATGAVPLLGRSLQPADGEAGATAVAVLSFDAWQRYFAASPSVIGRTARIDATPVQIVGVLPKNFYAFDDFELWLPLARPTLARPADSPLIVTPLVELPDEAAMTAATAELKATVAAVNGDYPQLFNAARTPALIPAFRMYTHGITPVVVMMSLIGLAVLLLGCVNISMVFLARLIERSRELALRTALGASRGRLLRQCLLETAFIVLLGLFAGYGLAILGIQWTDSISEFGQRIMADGRSSNLPELRPFDFVIAIAASAAVWLLSTLVPAWRIVRQDPSIVLAGSGKGAAARGSNKGVAFLVGLQVIISCVVLVTCGSLVTAVNAELAKPNGLKTSGVLMSTYPTVFDTRFASAAQRLKYFDDLAASVNARVPGAKLAFTTAPPTRPVRVAASIETQQGADGKGTLTLPLTIVSEGYFDLMGVSLRSGRLFDATDNDAAMKVAIVDEKMAARFWPTENVLGKRVRLNAATDASAWLTIVGVVSAVRGAPYRADADIGSLYQPLRQAAPQAFQVLIAPPPGGGDIRPALRAAAFATDRDLPLHNLQLLDDYLKVINMGNTAMAEAFIGIAFITALLAASGLFGLISRSVAQRTQEVGIRRALGATKWRATSMFMRQGALYLTVAVFGLVLGVMITPLLSKSIPNIVERVVPVTAGVVLLIAAVVAIASYLPTRRAVALEPGDALRYD